MVAVDIDGVVASVYEIIVAEATRHISIEPPDVGDGCRISKYYRDPRSAEATETSFTTGNTPTFWGCGGAEAG